jgi:ribosome biogenesis protein Tsr3
MQHSQRRTKHIGGAVKKVPADQELGIALPALIISNLVETGEPPDTVAVEAVSPEVAANMRELGYQELTADLLRAFIRSGDVSPLDQEELVDLRGPAVSALVGV